jgi:hypothetical protein
MSGRFVELNRVRVYEVAAHGPKLRTADDAVNLMSAASKHHDAIIAIPMERLSDDFFELRTRVAGELIQKFAMYGRRVAIVGDVSHRATTSKSLSAFIVESNCGRDLWFVRDLKELTNRVSERETGTQS